MRPLTSAEAAHLQRRREIFPQVLRANTALVTSLAELLGVGLPDTLEAEEALVDALDEFLGSRAFEAATEEDRATLRVRVAAFAGTYLARRCGGAWALQDDPDAPFFGHAVITGCGRPALDPANTPYVAVAQLAANTLLIRSLRREVAKLGLDGREPTPTSWLAGRGPAKT